jgi:hypothetical protein
LPPISAFYRQNAQRPTPRRKNAENKTIGRSDLGPKRIEKVYDKGLKDMDRARSRATA